MKKKKSINNDSFWIRKICYFINVNIIYIMCSLTFADFFKRITDYIIYFLNN